MTRDGPIRVVIADDHRVVREGLRAYFEVLDGFVLAAEAANGEEAIMAVDALTAKGKAPHVVLMDLLMEPIDGITATAEITSRHPEVRVVAMTSFVDERRVLSALEAGAVGYLLKDATAEEVASAIRAARRGEVALSPGVAQLVMSSLRGPRAPDGIGLLTEREREVLMLVAQGHANKEIARRLTISERTARTHVSNILAKLGLTSRTQAALLAVREGLVENA